MSIYVKSIDCVGVYQRFDLHHTFGPGVNVIYGINGAGKTTMLRILANVLNGEYRQFAFLDFKRIEIELSDGTGIQLKRTARLVESDGQDEGTALVQRQLVRIDVVIDGVLIDSFSVDDVRRVRAEYRREDSPESPEWPYPSHRSRLKAAYFPAFRVVVDASAALRSPAIRKTRKPGPIASQYSVTDFVRYGLGEFIPTISYPSVAKVQAELDREVYQVLLSTIDAEQSGLASVLPDVMASITSNMRGSEPSSEEYHACIEELRSLLQRIDASNLERELACLSGVFPQLRQLAMDLQVDGKPYPVLVPMLQAYTLVLERTFSVLDRGFAGLNQYFGSVNYFLEGKRLSAVSLGDLLSERQVDAESLRDLRGGLVAVFYGSGGTETDFRVLSSGERQIVSLVYAATHMEDQKVILIDEPEVSLHLDWQRDLMPELEKHLGDRQIIACTHSAVIYHEMDEIELVPHIDSIEEDLL